MSIKLKGSSDGSVSFDAPADTSPSGSDITLTLPTSAGSANQFLKNSGIAGELEYSSMVETSTGVGIGNSSPSRKLHIHDGTGSSAQVVKIDSGGVGLLSIQSGTTTDSRIEFGDSSNDDAGYIYYENDNDVMRFGVNASERARLDASGRLLVGTTSNFVRGNIQVVDNGGGEITIARDDTSVANGNDIGHLFYASKDGGTGVVAANISCYADGSHSSTSAPASLRFVLCPSGSTSPTERMRIGNAGETTLRPASYGMGVRSIAGSSSVNTAYFGAHSSSSMSTGTITFEVYTNGNVKNTNNSYGQLSDQRLKENIIDAPSQWDDIKSLQIRKYNFRDGNGYDTHTQIGLVAQEVEAVSPGLVQETPVREDATPVLDAEGNELEATKSVLTSVLYMKAVKALQEAQTRIETLESQHADLLARVTALEAA